MSGFLKRVSQTIPLGEAVIKYYKTCKTVFMENCASSINNNNNNVSHPD